MRLLLDTHIWIWSLQGSTRLGRRVQAELIDPTNERWLSSVSSYEALTLHSKGRLELLPTLDAWLPKAIKSFKEAPVTHEIAFVARQLPLQHQDPIDRLLAATAKVLNLTLVTADKTLLGLSQISTLPNL